MTCMVSLADLRVNVPWRIKRDPLVDYWWIGEFGVIKKEKKVDFLADLKCCCFLGGFKSEGALVGSNNNIRKTFSLVGRRALGD